MPAAQELLKIEEVGKVTSPVVDVNTVSDNENLIHLYSVGHKQEEATDTPVVGNGMGKPTGIAPATHTLPMAYNTRNPTGLPVKNSPKTSKTAQN